MGLFDWLIGSKSTGDNAEKRTLEPIDKELKVSLDRFIRQKYGTPYVTFDDRKRAVDIARKNEENRLRREAEKRTEQKHEEKEEPSSVSSPGVRYSLSSDDDIDSLSRQADNFYTRSNYGIMDSLGPELLRGQTFTDYLMLYINMSGMDNAEIYKRANLSKSVFSSILSKRHIPKKGTVVALAVALRLNLKETERLLMKAGYTFSNGIKGDLIAVYFINHGIFDIDKLNSALYEHGEPILGSKSY